MKNKKILLLTLLPLVPLLLVYLIYHQSINEYLKDKIFLSKIPKNIETTGAESEAIPNEITKSYNDLYSLLNKDPIITDSFTITPIPKKRVIEVQINNPVDKNTKKFEKWMIENKYDDIPKEKIIFLPSPF